MAKERGTMDGFGAFMIERDFECLLCQRCFTRVSGDLMLTEDMICDDCLAELQELNGNDVRKHVSRQLERNPLHHGRELEDEIVRIVQQIRRRRKRRKAQPPPIVPRT